MDELNCVSPESACDAVCSEKGVVECSEPGKSCSLAIPAFLIPIAEQLVAEYGPGAVAYLQKAAVAGIQALAARYNITPKPAS